MPSTLLRDDWQSAVEDELKKHADNLLKPVQQAVQVVQGTPRPDPNQVGQELSAYGQQALQRTTQSIQDVTQELQQYAQGLFPAAPPQPVQQAPRLQSQAAQPGAVALGGQPSPLVPSEPAGIANPQATVAYIRQAAQQRGIDPEVAVRVANSEGLNTYVGDNNSSFGPFQLHYGGVAEGGNRVSGLGDTFTAQTGLDARDPTTWRQQVDFALDQAKRGGWGPWHGAAAVGIGDREGIGGQTAQNVALPHREEPASVTDRVGDKWKTQFDFHATYTGNYRTGTPHRGIDLVPQKGGIGTPIEAFADGTVSQISTDTGGAGGRMVWVRDRDGLTHTYMHLQGEAKDLKPGAIIHRGDLIGYMGESGTEGSPHLHYEVRRNLNGDPLNQLIDPRPYIAGVAGSQPYGAPRPSGPVGQTYMGQQQGADLGGAIQSTADRVGGFFSDVGKGAERTVQDVLNVPRAAQNAVQTVQGAVEPVRQWVAGESQEAARAQPYSPQFQQQARQAAAADYRPISVGEAAGTLIPGNPFYAPGNAPGPSSISTQEDIKAKRQQINQAIEQHPALQDWPVPVAAGAAAMALQVIFDPQTYTTYGPSLQVGRTVAGGIENKLLQKLTASAIANGLQNTTYELQKPNPDPLEVGKQFILGAGLGSAAEIGLPALAKAGKAIIERGGAEIASQRTRDALAALARSDVGELNLEGTGGARQARRDIYGPEPMAQEGPTWGGGTTGISQSPTFLRESLRRMYPGAINKAAAKEAVQNSVDASRGFPGAVTSVNVDNAAKTISIVDQGKGMTPETMEDVFVKLGGSSKPAGASGGMGTAIKAIMANAEDTWVRTIGKDPDWAGQYTDSVMHGSGDDFLNGTMHRYYARLGEMPMEELRGAPLEIQQLHGANENITGTAIWTKPMADVDWSDYTLNNWINSFNKVSRISDQDVRFTVDGQSIGSDQIIRGSGGNRTVAPIFDRPDNFLKTIDTPGAEIDFYGSKGTSESGYTEVKLLNNGQYQADMFVQLPGQAKMPTTLVADVRATIGPKEVGYPWTADRNGLIDTAQQAVKDYVSRELAGDLIGKENTRISDLINNAPMVGPVKLVDDAGIANTSAADTFNKVSTNPAYRSLARINQDLHESLIGELYGMNIPNPEGFAAIGPSEILGLGVSDKWLGLNVPPSFTPWAGKSEARGILMNPWAIWMEVENSWPGATRAEQIDRFTDGLLATMIHEISHNTSVGGHAEGFAGILTRVPQFLGARTRKTIEDRVRSQLTKVWPTLGDQLSYDAHEFRRAAGESSLDRYGTAARGERLPERRGTPEDHPALPDQGGAGARRRPGGEPVPPGGASAGAEPQPGRVTAGPEPVGAAAAGTEPAATAPGGVPSAAVAPQVRSGGVRAAEATESLAQAITRIKPTLTPQQFAEAKADLAKMPRSGQRVIGLPPGVISAEDLAALRVHLNELVDEGVAGKDWYINSARKIKEAVGGDMAEAEKLAQLVGMMARNVNPEQNVNYAIEAWNQWKGGIPVANVHRFTDVSKSAADLLERGIPWEGRKTNSFYVNLMEELDPTLLAQRKVTADIWVNRAFGYHGKAPAGGQYNFIENELRRIATQRGQRPSQIQAQLWVGQMARQAPTASGASDFSHALTRRMGQVGWETSPVGETPGYAGATPEAQAAFNRDVGQVFLDDNGQDVVTRAMGALGGHTFEVPGGWQTQVGVAQTAAATPGGQALKPASRQAIEAVAAAKGWLLKQPTVGWTQVFPATTAKAANAVDVNAGRLLTVSEAQELSATLSQEMSGVMPLQGADAPFALTSTERGAWVRNTSGMPNAEFHKAVDAALQGVQSDVEFKATPVRADSGVVVNDWSAQPNGEGFLDAIRRGGRADAFGAIQDSLGQRVAAAQRDAAERHFGAAGGAEPEGGIRRARGEADPGYTLPLGGAAAGGYAGYVATPEDAPLEEKLRNIGIGATAGLLGGKAAGRGLRPPGAFARAAATEGFRAPGPTPSARPQGDVLQARINEPKEPGPPRTLGEVHSNPYLLREAPKDGPTMSPDEVADYTDTLETRLEDVRQRFETIDEMLRNPLKKPQRPPWAAGHTNAELVEIAKRHGVSAYDEGWWVGPGLETGSGEVRYGVGEAGPTAGFKREPTQADLRAERNALALEERDIRAVADQIAAGGEQRWSPRDAQRPGEAAADLPFDAGSPEGGPHGPYATETAGPSGSLAEDIVTRNGTAHRPSPLSGLWQEPSGVVGRGETPKGTVTGRGITDPTTAPEVSRRAKKVMPNLDAMIGDEMPEVRAQIEQAVTDNVELFEAYQQGRISHDSMVHDLATKVGMSKEDFLKTPVGKGFSSAETVALQAAAINSQVEQRALAQAIEAAGGVDALTPEQVAWGLSSLLDAARLTAVASGARSTAGRTLNALKIKLDAGMSRAVAASNELISARRIADQAKRAEARAKRLIETSKELDAERATVAASADAAGAKRTKGDVWAQIDDAYNDLDRYQAMSLHEKADDFDRLAKERADRAAARKERVRAAPDELLSALRAELAAERKIFAGRKNTWEDMAFWDSKAGAIAAEKRADFRGELYLEQQRKSANEALKNAEKEAERAWRLESGRQTRQTERAAAILERIGGEAPSKQLLADFVKAVNSGDDLAAAKFLKGLQDPGWWGKSQILRLAGLLSSTATHMANMVGNVSQVPVEVASHGLTVGIDWARAARTGGERQAYWAEMGPMLEAYGPGFFGGWDDFKQIMKTGILPSEQADLRKVRQGFASGSAKVDTAVEAPLRLLGAMDALFRGGAFAMHANRVATRYAIREGRGGASRAGRAADIVAHLEEYPELYKEAYDAASRMVFQENRPLPFTPNAIMKGGISQVAPFIKTPANITAQGFGLTPLGFGGVAEAIMNRPNLPTAKLEGQTLLAEQRAARATIGTLIMGGFMALGAGTFTGGKSALTAGYPRDPGEASRLPPGWREWSMRVEDGVTGNVHYVPFQNFGAAGVPMAMAALLTDSGKRGNELADEDEMARALTGIGEYVLDNTFMQGLSDAVNVLHSPERYGPRFIESLVSSYGPYSAMGRQMQRAYGVAARNPREGFRGFTDALISSYPGLSGNVPEATTPLGDPRSMGVSGIGAFASPVRSSLEADEPTLRALRAADVNIPAPPKAVNIGGGQEIELTEAEQDKFKRARGAYIRRNVEATLAQQGWKETNPTLARNAALQQAMRAATEAAKADFMKTMTGAEINARRKAARELEPTYIGGAP